MRLKFSVYRVTGPMKSRDELAETARGLLDGIGVHPPFSARDLADDKAEDPALDASEAGDHRGVIAIVADWLGKHLGGAPPIAVRHRVVHGGSG